MSRKLRHHYVPSGLTRNFCVEKEPIYYYDIKEDTIRPASPKDVFRIKNLHSIVKEGDEVDHNMVEDWLMSFERDGCVAIKKLLAGKSISQDERKSLCDMWGLQIIRTPIMRAGMENWLKEILRVTGKIADESGLSDRFGVSKIPNSLKQYGNSLSELLDNGTIGFFIVPQATMKIFAALPKVIQSLSAMNWCLLESSEDHYFLLSDNPCAIIDPYFDIHGMGIGIESPSVEVTFPVGKNHCLLASWNKIPSTLKASKRHVLAINQRTALFGQRFYTYPFKSKKILNFLNLYADVGPEMQAESIPTERGDRVGYMTIYRQNITKSKSKRIYKSLRLIFPNAIRRFKGN